MYRLNWTAQRENPFRSNATVTFVLMLEERTETGSSWDVVEKVGDDPDSNVTFTIRTCDYSCLDDVATFRIREDRFLARAGLSRNDLEEIKYPW